MAAVRERRLPLESFCQILALRKRQAYAVPEDIQLVFSLFQRLECTVGLNMITGGLSEPSSLCSSNRSHSEPNFVSCTGTFKILAHSALWVTYNMVTLFFSIDLRLSFCWVWPRILSPNFDPER